MTRKQIAVFILSALGELPSTCTGTIFVDVTEGMGPAYCRFIEKCASLGITKGCDEYSGSSAFCPDNPVSRAEMAAMTIRAFKDPLAPYSPTPYFSDVPERHPFFNFIQLIMDEGILQDGVIPMGFDFGLASANLPRTQTFTITNTGDQSLQIENVSITGDSSSLSKANDTCSTQTLLPSENCTLDVVFSPSVTGPTSADLNIPSNDQHTPILVWRLLGYGDRYTITTFVREGNGTISCESPVDAGADSNCTLTPSLGYRITDVWVDGISQGAMSSYTFTNVMSGHTLEASFIRMDPVIISGYLTERGVGLQGVSMNGLPGNPLSDQSGFYTASVDYGWSGTVVPSKYRYLFQPPSRIYTVVTGNQTNQNYAVPPSPPSINLGITTGAPGAQVTVPLVFRNTPGYQISAIFSEISFDVNKLENPHVGIGQAAIAAGKTILSNVFFPGVLRIGVISNSNPTLIGDGIMANVSFDIKQGTSAAATVLVNTPHGSDPLGNDVRVIGRDGIINVITERFNDVPGGHWAEDYIYALSGFGITSGCGNNDYCGDNPISRGQMAVFIVASLGRQPVPCAGQFTDVASNHPFCGFIEQLAADRVTGGCEGSNFCPDAPVTRGQMAVFMEAALGNSVNGCVGQFSDVLLDNPFCAFIERLANDGITGGCGGGNFCPNNPVTRAEMAVFLVAAPAPLNP